MSYNPFAEAAAELENQEIGGQETDSLGGRQLHPTDMYLVTVTNFFQHKYDSGAQFIVVEGKDADGKTHRYQETVSNKAGSITYERDGKKNFMPGYNKMNGLAMLLGQVELPKCTWEQKQVKLWSKAAGGEVLTPVAVATNLLGKQVYLGIFEQSVNQTQKNEQTNKYEPICDENGAPLVTDENVIDKAFYVENKKTLPEIRAKAEKAKFFDEWTEKYAGKGKLDRVKTTGLVPKRGGNSNGGNNTNAAGTQTQAPAENLFG